MDFQLTLPPLLRRAETYFPDKQITTRLPDKSFHRYTYRDCCPALPAARGGAPEARARARRPRRDARVEPLPAHGVLPRHPVRRLRPPHAQPPSAPVRSRVHRHARRRQGGNRRPTAAAAARPVQGGHADRARFRRRGLVRGAPGYGRPGRLAGPRARRERGGRHVLHERHHGRVQGRRLLTPLDDPAHARRRLRRAAGAPVVRGRHVPAGRADVPRQCVGLPVPRDDDGREPRLPGPAPRRREPARRVRAGAGDVDGGSADDLARHPRAARRESRQVGPLQASRACSAGARRRRGR